MRHLLSALAFLLVADLPCFSADNGTKIIWTGDDSNPGNALYFNGSNEYVTANGVCQALNNPADLTIECWFCPTFGGASSPYLLAFNTSDGSNNIQIGTSSDHRIKLYSGIQSYYGTTTLLAGVWYHVALTIDASDNAALFLNGIEETINTVTVRPPATGKFSIGQEWDGTTPTDFFQGEIDEVRIWNVARSPEQIRQNIHQIIDPVPAELVVYYPFDEISGAILPDISGNGIDGTLINMDNSNWVPSEWPYGAPYVATAVLSGFTYHALTGGGDVVGEGSSPVSARGLLWDINQNPELASCLGFTSDGTGAGSFVSNVSGLSEGTTYYFRAYAINATDTAYGAVLSYTTGIQAPTNALDFDGVNDYVIISDEPAFDFTNAMTVEAWLKVDSFTKTWQAIITKGDNSWRIHRYNNTGYITFDTDGTGEEHLISNTAMNDGKWHHIAAVYNGSVKYLYIDGRLDNMIVTSGNISANNYSVMFGENAQQTGRQFDGKMDEVRIWNTPLDAETIREHVHLSLQGNESGLVGYWQFNESSGGLLHDFLNANHGILFGFSSPACWIKSTIPLGGGASDTRTETNGTVDFTGTGISMFYNAHNGATVTVSKIDTFPNIFPVGNDTVFSEQYWAINRFGTGSFNANISFAPQEDILEFDELHPETIKLYSRLSNSEGAWSFIKTADSVNAVENFIVFNNLNSPGQFIITCYRNPEISIDPLLLNFGNVVSGDSAILTMNIFNEGSGPLMVSGIVTDHPDFTVFPSSGAILPDNHLEIEVKFKPQSCMVFSNTLTVYSDDADEPETLIFLSGKVRRKGVALLELPHSLSLESDFFNSIDVGDRSAPCFTDLDNDGLLDLIVGKTGGYLSHYEQQNIQSDLFALVDEWFNYIDVGSYAYPCFTNLDGDCLLDLIIGGSTEGLKYYEQQSQNSTSFTFVTHIAFIYGYASPSFSDLDGDGLLDIICGTVFGTLCHFEQQSIHSTSFSLVTVNFNGIDVGSLSSSNLTDVDDDGRLDLIIGNEDGILNHYEQQSVNSTTFDFIPNSFQSIDVGYNSTPCFTDMNGNSSYDLVIGKSDGTLSHYKTREVDTLNFEKLMVGNSSVKKYFVKALISGSDIELHCSNSAYSISSDENSGYSQNLSLPAVNQIIADTVYVRFQPSSPMEYKGYIMHIAPLMDTIFLTLEGEGVIPDNFPGTALDFDGSDDYVNLGTDLAVTGNLPRTIEAWACAEAFNDGGIFQAGQTGANGKDFSLRTTLTDNQWKMQFWGTAYDLIVTLPDSKSKWHHYCMTYDGSTARLYYDGALMASKAMAINTGSHDVWLGRWENSYFKGKIDEVRMWDYALDSIQVRENMHLVLSGVPTGLLGYWQMNEGSGSEVSNIAVASVGNLINMDDSCWVASTFPFGGGASDSQIEANGTVDFSGTGLSVYYNLHNAAAVTATRIDTLPNIFPDDLDSILQYWAVHRYGSGTFNADVKFSLNEDILPGEENYPQYFRLYSRPSTSDEEWILLSTADSVNSGDDFLIFEGIEDFSQFIIGKKSSPEISVSHAVLNFGNVVPGDSATLAFYIHNAGNDTLFVYDIVADHPDFSVNPSTAA
ncbi:MAG: choice-of-anchor D domain-containing protein, partial [Bacteroidales bacterium]|nr:choice-of-anchor D domain-containing protein [Bacteroidales bacterium]